MGKHVMTVVIMEEISNTKDSLHLWKRKSLVIPPEVDKYWGKIESIFEIIFPRIMRIITIGVVCKCIIAYLLYI